jgi:DNA-binding SARP family transcriptional activator
VEFRILGPLEVVENGLPLPLGSRKQRALLALLVLHAGEVVSRDRLIDDLWHGDPPAAAATTLRSHVSRLRASLGATRLLSRPPGYGLVVGPDELDAARCERLLADGRHALAEGRAAQAAEVLRAALGLWRGPPLLDVTYAPFAQGAIGRLEELRLTLLEERIEADLMLARHVDLVRELEVLVAEHPLRERLRGQLMLALYRSGRQADALESYQQARRALTEELGLEPSETLKELQRAILAHDSSLQPPDRREADLARRREVAAPGAGPFVGREAELRDLFAGLEEALAGEGRLYLISGEPGIGKSRLLEHVARRARERGAGLVVGRCWEAGGAPAYWPWVQALRTYMRDREPELLRRELGRCAADLAQILPELNDLYGELAAPPSTDPDGARFRLFEAATSFLRTSSLTQPLAIVLDDLHAADAPSLLLLRFVADGLTDARLFVIGAYRDVDPSLRDPLAETVAELRRLPVTRSLELGGLPEVDVASFISLATGLKPARHLVSALHRATDGNPLFVGEALRLFTSEEALASITDVEGWRRMLPEGVRVVIRRRLGHLSDNCRLVLVLAAVLGREFELAALERVSSVSGDQLLGVLDEAARERVVTDVPGQPGRMRFAHLLIRDTLYDELIAGRRAQLHRRVGDALEGLYANNLDAHLAELAHHFYESARPDVDEKALAYARRAAERSLNILAYEEAARLYGVALRVIDRMVSPENRVRCDLLLALGDAYGRAGDTPRSKQTYEKAARLAETLHLPDQLGRAALGYGGRITWGASRDDGHLADLLERALHALPDADSSLRVRLLARLAGGPLRDSTADPERRRSLGTEALEMARRIGDPSTLAGALSGYANSQVSPDFAAQQAALATELVAVALEAGDLERAVEGYQYHVESSIELGDLTSAHADLDAMARLADELRQPAQSWLVCLLRAHVAVLEGRFAEAEQLIAEGRSLGNRVQPWEATMYARLQLYVLRRELGRLDELDELVTCAVTAYPTYPIWRCVFTNMLAGLGSTGAARAELDALGANGFEAIPFDEEWEISLCLLAEAAARLGDRGHAGTLHDLLVSYGDRVATGYPEISLGPIARFLGILSSTTGRWDDAEQHLLRAIELSERIGARPSLAHAEEDYAQVLLRRGRPEDADRARALRERARATYGALGMSVSTTSPAAPVPSAR